MSSPAESTAEELTTVKAASTTDYKPSRFNAHTMNEEGHLILYNSFSGHVCAFDPPGATRVKTQLSRAGTSGPLDKLGEYLLRKGYIIEANVDEDARFDVRYGILQFRTDVLELILLASEDCNLRCVYCSQQFKRGSMLPQVRSGIRNLVQKRIAKLQRLQISWFGGEPLMGYDSIEELGPFFQNVAKDNAVIFHSDITTNGYLLTPDRSRKMVRWGIRDYQITLDGGPLEHDSHRALKDGKATFTQIMENIIAMKSFPEQFTVAVRVNFDNTNVHKLQPLFSLLKQNLGDDSRFVMRFRPVEKWGGSNDAQLDTCKMDELHQQWTSLVDEARAMGLRAEELSQTLDPRHGVCYAARPNSYIIGADGKLMKCTVVLDTNPNNIVGRLAEDGTISLREDNFAKWVQPYYKSDRMCSRCFYVPVCQGVCCPRPRVLAGERPCPIQKLRIRDTLNFVWREKQSAEKHHLVRISTQ